MRNLKQVGGKTTEYWMMINSELYGALQQPGRMENLPAMLSTIQKNVGNFDLILVDSGTIVSVCPVDYAEKHNTRPGGVANLQTASGEPVNQHG